MSQAREIKDESIEERNKRHIAIIEEAVKILYDYPELTHSEAIKKAKEVLGYEEAEND